MKSSYRTKRMIIWTWFIDVLFFRILSQNQIFLHGIPKLENIDIEKMEDTSAGHIFAAERFAKLFADSYVTNGNGLIGFMRYADAIGSTKGKNPREIPCSPEQVAKVWSF